MIDLIALAAIFVLVWVVLLYAVAVTVTHGEWWLKVIALAALVFVTATCPWRSFIGLFVTIFGGAS